MERDDHDADQEQPLRSTLQKHDARHARTPRMDPRPDRARAGRVRQVPGLSAPDDAARVEGQRNRRGRLAQQTNHTARVGS